MVGGTFLPTSCCTGNWKDAGMLSSGASTFPLLEDTPSSALPAITKDSTAAIRPMTPRDAPNIYRIVVVLLPLEILSHIVDGFAALRETMEDSSWPLSMISFSEWPATLRMLALFFCLLFYF